MTKGKILDKKFVDEVVRIAKEQSMSKGPKIKVTLMEFDNTGQIYEKIGYRCTKCGSDKNLELCSEGGPIGLALYENGGKFHIIPFTIDDCELICKDCIDKILEDIRNGHNR